MARVLTQDEVKSIAIQSGIEVDVIKSWYKDFIEICPKGKMDKKQFAKFYKILRGLSDNMDLSKIIDHVFSCFDKDSNGTLDFSEFLIAYSGTTKADPKKKLEFVFSFYDKDKNGKINHEEFLHGLNILYEYRGKSKKEYPPEKCLRDILGRIDDNGDFVLTKEEFIQGCMKNKNMIDLVSPFELY